MTFEYFIEVGICWLFFYILYHFVFRKETFFQLNRVYLLSTLVIGLIIPFFEIPVFSEAGNTTDSNYLQAITVGVEEITQAVVITAENAVDNSVINWLLIFFWIYWVGVALLGIRLLYGLSQILTLYNKATILRKEEYHLIRTKQAHLPFSFFNLLFWSEQLEIEGQDAQKIIKHEQVHIRQKHSIDVLLSELLCIFFWCCPLVWFYKKSLRNVHEFLADDAVLKTTHKKQYGQLLLRQSQSGMQIALGNHFIQSQLKSRITMMMKTKSKQQYLFKYLFALPILAMLLVFFSTDDIRAQATNVIPNDESMVVVGMGAEKPVPNEVFVVVEEMPLFAGCESAKGLKETQTCSKKMLFDFMIKNIKYPKAAKEAGKEGMVVVKFIVSKEGSVIKPEVVKSAGFGMDEEALRVVYAMPDWTPGKQGGKAVNVELKLPFKFALPKEDKESAEQSAPVGKVLNGKEVDELPFFPGCTDQEDAKQKRACSDKNMLTFLYTNIKYPKKAREENASGMAVVQFVVTEDGSVEDAKIVRSVHPLIDAEVIRIVNDFPVWEPGMKDGKAVAVQMALPVKFKIQDDKAVEKTKDIKDINNPANHLPIENFKAFPNPASDKLSIEFSTEAQGLTLTLTDATGKEILRNEVKDYRSGTFNFVDMDVSEAARGALIISISSENGKKTFSEKVILQ